MMFVYLENFEAEAITKASALQSAAGSKRSILETFGIAQEMQTEIWTSMSLEELKAECEKHSLVVPAEASITNTDESS